jgi:hypothetical protein
VQKGASGLAGLLVLGLGLGILRGTANPGQSTSSRAGQSTGGYAGYKIENYVVPPPAEECKTYRPEKDLLDTIDDFEPPPAAPAGEGEKGSAKDDPVDAEFKNLAKSGREIHFAIAIVPDPVHTHLSLFFDRTIDALQQGAQQAEWIFDRATMPWDSEEHPEPTDFRLRLQEKFYQDCREELPGLMILRPSRPVRLNTSIFILVVGETPTGGVNKTQFENAVQWMSAYAAEREAKEKKGKKKESKKSTAKDSAANKPATKDPLRIIGPTFSGSLYSLVQLLKNLPSKKPFDGVVIRSGTVSSWETIQWFAKQWPEGGLKVDFATFQHSDKYLLRKFIEFEKKRGYQPDKIAVLAEDETAYGNREPDATAKANLSRTCEPSPSYPTASTPRDEQEKILQADESCVLQLYFPRDISQLRSQYQQGVAQKETSSSDSYKIRSTLPLNLQDTGSDDDSVEQYAHSQTPLSQEAILLGIVAALRENHIQYVVVQATNPIDTVFLSSFLKKGFAEARVVAMPADLLMSRDTADVSLLHGVMALTTYSLLPNIDAEVAVAGEVDAGTRADHVFPSANAAGTYNATISQVMCLGGATSEACSGTASKIGIPAARYSEYGWPSMAGDAKKHELGPVVWITVLGRNGFWPLKILPGWDAEGLAEPSPPKVATKQSVASTKKYSPPTPTFWRIFCGLIIMVMVGYWVLLSRGSVVASTSGGTVLAPVIDPSRPVLIVVMNGLLLAAALMLMWPWLAWSPLDNKWFGLSIPVWWPVILGAGVVVVFALECQRALIRRRAGAATWMFIGVAGVLAALFLLVYWIDGHSADALSGEPLLHSTNAFLYRYIHLTSGVSPLLPFLCLLAGGLWWAWFSLVGLALVDKRRPRLPRVDQFGELERKGIGGEGLRRLQALTEESTKKLVKVMQPAARDARVYFPVASVLIVTLFGVGVHDFHPLLTLETGHFEMIYAVALAIGAIVLLAALFQMLVMWLEFRKILGALDRLPLRRAFAELHFTWEPVWRPGGVRWQDLLRLTSRQEETLEHLQSELSDEGSNEADTLMQCIRATAREQSDLIAKVGAARAPGSRLPQAKEPALSDYLIDSYGLVLKSIACSCAAAMAYLQMKWKSDEGLILTEITSGGEAKEDGDVPGLALSTRLAERFVALVYLNFMLNVVLRMRTVVLTASGLYIFMVLSINSYPFEPSVTLRSIGITMLVVLAGMVGYVSAQLHRDSILSLVTQTTPGELGIEFWIRMGTFIALPLISLLVSQFPALNNALFSWLEPAANALK